MTAIVDPDEAGSRSRRDAAARGAVVSGYHGTLDFDWYRTTSATSVTTAPSRIS